ncbi:MAG TPA: BBP7 family outer membrane beta-barrel protein [Gemmataceae bacterium]|nr:BBP7 family outer membrane beta-barrel protein [Gemmataceae bacterium]
MRKGFLAALGTLLAGAGLSLAQPVPYPGTPLTEGWLEPGAVHGFVSDEEPGLEEDCLPPDCGRPPLVWASAEYLLWWVKDGPLPLPLVTVGDPADIDPGALGQPGTRILFGQRDLHYGSFAGGRLAVGSWLNKNRSIGLEGTLFLLERRSDTFRIQSDAAGAPLLAFPFINPTTGAPHAVLISEPAPGEPLVGGVAIASSSRLWGAEASGGVTLVRMPCFSMGALGGFRYMDLDEDLRLFNPTIDPAAAVIEIARDRFETRNQFFGGQLGTWFGFRWRRFTLDLTGKCALGTTHQVLNISGAITQTGAGATTPGTFPGGVFTQPTNMGRFTRGQFTVLPQAQLRLGVNLLSNVQAYVGYDFLYWNNVIRPGEQVDRALNLTQSPIFGTGQLMGPARPTVLFNRSEFWAHGANFGVEVRY